MTEMFDPVYLIRLCVNKPGSKSGIRFELSVERRLLQGIKVFFKVLKNLCKLYTSFLQISYALFSVFFGSSV